MLNSNTNDGKNLLLVNLRDQSGCSHYRARWSILYYAGFDSLGYTPVICPIPTFDGAWLARAKCILFQRPIGPEDVELVKRYKALQPKFGYKMVFEVDDQVFEIDGQCIPEYNTASLRFNAKLFTENIHKIIGMFDEIVVSTDYLKGAFEKVFDVHNVRVVRNVVPRFLWSYPRKKHIEKDIEKPTVVYSGSPCHYRNPIPAQPPSPQNPKGIPALAPLKGDMDNAWCDWIIKNVREDKINFVVMGALPWFWEEIRQKIKFIPWVDCNSFPRQVMETNADFSFASLVNNVFNKCKSSLRFTESCAAGQVFLGTVFNDSKDSPYEEINEMCKVKEDATVSEIDEIFWNLCKKDNYNKVLDWQYDFINKGGFWLESDKHTDEWLQIVDGGPQKSLI